MNLIERLYRDAYTIRRCEESLLELFQAGKVHGTVHTCIGQELCAVGMLSDCNSENSIVLSNHRGHGHYLAFTNDLEGLILELIGDHRGVCGGAGGSQHLANAGYYSNGIQGGMVPCAAGIAFSERLNHTDKIVYVFIGDGTMGQGVVYETFNMAQLYSLKIIFVLENNRYAQSTPIELAHAGDITTRAKSFGIYTIVTNGNDIDSVMNACATANSYVRSHSLPVFIILNTYRLMAHSKGDDIRDPIEVQMAWNEDPLIEFRKKIAENNAIEIEKKVNNRINKILGEVNGVA